MSFFINDAFAAGAANQATSEQGSFSSLMILAVFMVALYFIVWRPQNKKAKDHKDLVANLSKGDEVVTTGGIIGKIIKVSENFVIINVSENVDVSFQKNSIANILPKGMMKKAI